MFAVGGIIFAEFTQYFKVTPIIFINDHGSGR